jgi:1,4-dihydroxy-2-naphthoate octaprenyltransferase
VKFKAWLLAIRPKTLGASLAPVILGSAISTTTVKVSWPLFGLTLLGAILLQIGSNLVNDYYDFLKGSDGHDRLGPTRVMQAGLVSATEMKNAIAAVFILATFVGAALIWVGGWPIFLIGVLSIACAIAYTAGPFPLAYLGLGDIFVFWFFGPVAVCGTYYLQTHRWDLEPFLMSLSLGALAVAILTVNNVRDYNEDLKSQKKTVVVRFGSDYGKFQYTACLLLSFILPTIYYYLGYSPCGTLLSLGLFLFSIPMIKSIWSSQGAALNKLLAQTAQFLVLYSLVNAYAWYL